MKLKYLLLLIFTFGSIYSLFAKPYLNDTLFFVNSTPVYNKAVDNLEGKGEADKIELTLIEDDYDYSNFVLTINNDTVSGKHSYNVSGFLIIDLDTTDNFKEVAVYTQNANGPDEYIIYKYDNWITEIGRINSYATFPGNKEIIVDTEMMFWTKTDTVLYDTEFEVLKHYPKEFYYINMEAKVLESFSLYSDRENFISVTELKPKDRVTIVKCDTSPFCEDELSSSFELCDWYQVKIESGRTGWVQLKTFLDKLELPWRP
ncbi:MAG: hypothetical protein H8D45_22285 [Bacteroidetes bacterium]|nr:hypothetical protein [Bacteroidota bacterium]